MNKLDKLLADKRKKLAKQKEDLKKECFGDDYQKVIEETRQKEIERSLGKENYLRYLKSQLSEDELKDIENKFNN
jgi:hypothetical protein